MKPFIIKPLAYIQLCLAAVLATGCTSTQPFFLNESPDLQHYLNTATQIEYPDVEVESLADTTNARLPLSIGNHEYEFWNLTLEECVSIALQNSKFFITTSGNAESRQNVAAQITSSGAEQVGSIYDVAITQTTTQSVPLAVDGNGNRTLPRGVLRANQIGGVEDALAEFDAQPSAFLSFSTTDRPRNTGDSTVSTSVTQTTDVTQQAALSKRFATGGVATLRQQIIYGRSNLPLAINPGGNTSQRLTGSDYTFLLEAQVQHPLMRNRGTLVNRIPVVLASLNEDLTIADFEIQTRNLIRDIENAYWELYVSYRNVSTSIVARNSAIATAKFAQLSLENGTGNIQELSQAKAQYNSFKGQLIGALGGSNLPGNDRLGVYGNERRLREMMGIASSDGRLIRPIEEPSLARVEFDWDECRTQMLYLSPELRRARTVLKQRELEQISAKNQLLPEVNLSFLYRWVGVGDTLGPSRRNGIPSPLPGSSALASFTGGNFQEGVVRLEITPTAIGSRREKTRVRGAQLQMRRARAFVQEVERLMVSQLSEAVAKTASHYAQLQAAAQEWQELEKEVDGRLAAYKGGREQVNVVLQSQQRRAQAQLKYYQTLSEYNKSLNYVDFLKGTLLANSNITLREGTWDKKAYWDALEKARQRSAGKQTQYGVTRPNVVRRGPVMNAASANHFIQGETDPSGDLLPPDASYLPEPSASLNDLERGEFDFNLDDIRSPIEPPVDSSLSEIDGTFNLQRPQAVPQDQFPQPIPDATPDHLAPGDLPPGQGPFDPLGSGVEITPLSHEVDISGAPAPVRRRSVTMP